MIVIRKLIHHSRPNTFRFLSSIKQHRTMKFLNQEEATAIGIELFNDYKFSVDQLMELTGLSCSHAIKLSFPSEQLTTNKILICVGVPMCLGDNGGDGLVCARHLSLMGYEPEIYYPLRRDKELYHNLVHQCKSYGLKFLDVCPNLDTVNRTYSIIVDGIFGFMFRPPIRQNYVDIMNVLYATNVPIASIDIPSGWDVEKGPIGENDIKPKLLISLTAPKLCARYFRGDFHYLGGRFVPLSLSEKYQLDLVKYNGVDSCVKLN